MSRAPSYLRMILDVLAPAERRRLWLLLPLVILSAALETVGVASVVPLLSLVSDPASIERNRWLSWAYTTFAFDSRESFFFAVGLAVLLLMTVANAVAAASLWGQLRFSWLRNHTISTRLLHKYLSQPYEFFLNRNSAELSANILSETQVVVAGVILQAVQLSARAVSILLICAALLLIDPWLALGVSGAFGGIYGLLFLLVRRSMARSGAQRKAMNHERFQVAAEALGGVKELKLYGLEPVAIEAFAGPSKSFAEKQADNALVANLPRFALETIAFGGILAMVLYQLRAGGNLATAVPVLGLFVFAAYRLLPAVQTIFSGATALRFNAASLAALHKDLVAGPRPAALAGGVPPVAFESSVGLVEATFAYAPDGPPALRGLSLTIAKGEWVALVGPTGSGKSTLADLLLGLLVPSGGSLRVDDRPLTESRVRRGWQNMVAYVPQMIFLLDDTVERNIAFGVPAAQVDRSRLEWAARVAQIHEFVSSELPAGYRTVIGERGVRLSGGQRQRLGVARALYRAPRFLVLDEATSALDDATEEQFFRSLRAELRGTTVVSIAHRLTTTRYFDRVVRVVGGVVADEDSREPRHASDAGVAQQPRPAGSTVPSQCPGHGNGEAAEAHGRCLPPLRSMTP